jgi:hypothetical protein
MYHAVLHTKNQGQSEPAPKNQAKSKTSPVSEGLERLRKSAVLNVFRRALLVVAAGLVADGAGGFARGLAGRLAFAATAVLRALFECRGRNCFDVFHVYLPSCVIL